DEVEPAVPPGLGELSGPLRSLADFLRLDQDLLAVAAEASRSVVAKAPSAAALERWGKGLPEEDKDKGGVRLPPGRGPHLRTELLRQFHGSSADHSTVGRRTVGELLAAAEAHRAKRQELIEQRKAAERARREQAAAAAREKRLQALAAQQE